MSFELNTELEHQPPRTRTWVISAAIHAALIALLVLRPDLLETDPKRIIRIAGVDYDLSKQEIRELTLPPSSLAPRTPPPAVDTRPLAQPPTSALPSPPPPPPAPVPPDVVISPDDVIADGARPDAAPRASRGDTREQARTGGLPAEPSAAKAAPPSPPKGDPARPPQTARNTNPNALSLGLPNLRDQAGQIQDQLMAQARTGTGFGGSRTGTDRGQAGPNFSADGDAVILSDTRGYDFGPYLNQVVNMVRDYWYSIIPESVRYGGQQGRVVIVFTIIQTGAVKDLEIVSASGADPLDRAAKGAITGPHLPRLPATFDGNHLDLQFTFLYNLKP